MKQTANNLIDQEIFREDALNNCNIQNGIYSFVTKDPGFYEGHYKTHVAYVPRRDHWPFTLPIWLINSGYLWEVRRNVKAGSKVLEFGCASGVAYFGKRYSMTGLDLSLSSLHLLRDHYQTRVHASAEEALPFSDQAFDAVISSFFWEHLTESTKRFLGEEMYRILKPGGKAVFLYDLETKNPLINHFKKKDAKLYRKIFLEGDGHVGYQPSLTNQKVFVDSGFQVLRIRGLEKSFFQSPSVYTKLSQWPGQLARILGFAVRLTNGPAFYLYTFLMRILNATVDRVLPKDWARIEMVTLKKSSDSIQIHE